ncbi:hypothetical protein EVAR_40896_1 [Eumeta japonica]|uniref:Uncharacterized protein n=1 Tax=Eumeta variegata TaxID=151549 RepID=A0A4C1X3P3_EUMVA|nr:hypothetical protein EVAR_40896_1 [Eumeta japonica]
MPFECNIFIKYDKRCDPDDDQIDRGAPAGTAHRPARRHFPLVRPRSHCVCLGSKSVHALEAAADGLRRGRRRPPPGPRPCRRRFQNKIRPAHEGSYGRISKTVLDDLLTTTNITYNGMIGVLGVDARGKLIAVVVRGREREWLMRPMHFLMAICSHAFTTPALHRGRAMYELEPQLSLMQTAERRLNRTMQPSTATDPFGLMLQGAAWAQKAAPLAAALFSLLR